MKKVISFSSNGKTISCNPDTTFGELFDLSPQTQGQFKDAYWIIDGQQKEVTKQQKINLLIRDNSNVQIQRTQLEVIPPRPSYQPTITNPPLFPAFSEPRISIPVPLKPVIYDPINKPTRQILDIESGEKELSKEINNFIVTITDWGKQVIIESKSKDFKAVLLEKNAKNNQITFTPSEVIMNQDEQLRLYVGKDRSCSTKVVFLTNYEGLAINWYSGLITKFQFKFD